MESPCSKEEACTPRRVAIVVNTEEEEKEGKTCKVHKTIEPCEDRQKDL